MAIDLDSDSEESAAPAGAPQAEPVPADAATGSIAAEEAPAQPAEQRWFLLRLPPAFEAWAERFRRLASTYLVCQRGFPRVARTAERLWRLSGAGGALPLANAAGRGAEVPQLCEDGETAVRRLLRFARDTFALHWAPELDPIEQDPCSLRDLRAAQKRILCVSYCGPNMRMRPADVVRGELQLRRRLVEHLNEGARPEQPLPLCELPAEGCVAPATARPARAAKALTPAKPSAATAAPALGEATAEVGLELVEALKREPWYHGQVAHVGQVAPRAKRLAALRARLDPRLQGALQELVGGNSASSASTPAMEASDEFQLYSHQAAAIDAAVADRRDVIISTSTGSGKSLVYLAAVFEALLQDVEASAVLIFPTKALAQDQLRALGRLTAALAARGVPEDELLCACLDGDTPPQERARVRRTARIVLTNPDMLHSHILPRHMEYSRLLGSLRYVVLDEVHVYRGAFGAHTASVLRRLRRLSGGEASSGDCLSSSLRFVACSATVANPGEHFERMLGPRAERPVVITEDGSPSGARLHVLWNPELLPPQARGQLAGGRAAPADGEEGLFSSSAFGSGAAAEEAEPDPEEARAALAGSRRSPIVEVARLLAWLVARGVSVLAFCKWRSLVEIILQDVKEALAASGQPEAAARVVSYRAGYPPATRRELERRIFTREALGVACTNALELGVDIGRLDCTISLGFPGSIASLRQQFGRAGRAGRPGLSFFVAWDDPTDQHLVRHPKELLARRPEAVALAPANPVVLRAHLPCAAVERPLEPCDAGLWAAPSAEMVGPDAGEEPPASAPWDEALRQCLQEGSLQKQPGPDGALTVPNALRAFGGPHKKVAIRSVEVRYEVVAERSDGCRTINAAEAGGFVRPSASSAAEGYALSYSVIDEVDESKAFYSLFPGSVYRLRGEEYHIVDLNLQRRRAVARKCEAPLPYYTRAFDSTVFRILTRERRQRAGGAKICCGRVERESRVKSFRRYWKAQDVPQETEVELDLPSWGLRTRGLWFETTLAEQGADPVAATQAAQVWTWAGAHAAMHALLRVFPLFVLAERADLDAACVDEHGAPPMDRPRLLVYDAQHGGLGLCDEAFPHAAAMLREARRLVEGCPCEDGCPSCIVDPRCLEYNRLLSKKGALTWLRGLEGSGAGSASDASDSGAEE